MRRRIEALSDRLEEFVSEDAHDALVIECIGEAASGLVGAAADLLEQRGSSDVFVPALEPWVDRGAFAAKLIAWVDAFLGEAELAARPEQHGAPLQRLAHALVHLADAVSALGDVRVVLFVCPSEIHDPRGYVETVIALVRATRDHHPPLRLAFREVAADRALRVALGEVGARTLDLRVDGSMAALRDAMAQEAADPSNDPEVRASALLSAAMGDAASGRGRDALPVLAALAAFFEARGDGSSRALCFVLTGNVLAELGEVAEARDRVAQGLAIAVQARAFGILVGGAMLAGHLSLRLGDVADADARFDVAARLGAKLGAPLVVTEALLARASLLAARGLERAACDAWLCAAEAARRASSDAHERHALSQVAQRYRDAGTWEELAPIERRLDALRRVATAGCAHAHEHAS